VGERLSSGDSLAESDDGVVEYESAHLDGVASNYIVPSGRSCQSNPLTIREVRRILIEHLRPATAGPTKSSSP
jgi:hypothetical protein